MAPTFAASVILNCANALGEGIMWDEVEGLLHWVDIDRAQVHSYDPKSGAHAVDGFPQTTYITALTARNGPGLIAATQHSIVSIETSPPGSGVTTREYTVLASPLNDRNVRFNDGACDPSGRFWVGSMTLPEARDGVLRGEMYVLGREGVDTVMEGIGTSNGIDWSPDGSTMYYIDSDLLRVDKFDYDVGGGSFSNRQVFVSAPEGWTGAFDGLIVDGVGNVWVARWGDSRVMVYSPEGKLLLQVDTPGARSPTIPCFGGENLDTLYIATAHSSLAGQGDIQDQYPNSGDLFALDCGPDSPIRAVLGAEWKGRARHRFAG